MFSIHLSYRLTYIVCATILMVSFWFIYCAMKRKIASVASSGNNNFSKMKFEDAMKISTYRRALQDEPQLI